MNKTIAVKRSVLGEKTFRTLVISNTNYDNRTLRPYQQRIILDHLGKNAYTLTESPTGSGKSTIMLCHAAKSIKDGMKVVIATPQLGINEGFRRYTQNGFSASTEKQAFRLPIGAVTESTSKKSYGVRRYLLGPSKCVHVCSYAALIIALEDESLSSALANTVILIDEAHHSNFGNNSLGSLIELCLEKCAEVHGFTATAFRSDGEELFNGEFVHFRRTLKEHYRDPYDKKSYCPDFGIYVKFYQEVSKKEFDEFEYKRDLGSSEALIAAYLEEYEEHPLPTIMLVDTAEQAFDLQKAIENKFCDKNFLNLGSDDRKTLVSQDSNKLKRKFKKLANDCENIDIVIAIRLMNEGIDWPVCAQTFSPRISSSLQLLMQRAIGRALRLKSGFNNHQSPDYSRIVLFEIGIKDDDKDLCTKALFELAVRLKALCEGLDFADEFRFRLRREERERIDSEKEEVKNKSNPQLNNELLQRLCESAARGASAMDLAEEYAESRLKLGVRIDPKNALEILIECGIVAADSKEILQDAFDRFSSSSKENARKLNNRLTFAEFRELFGEVLDKIQVVGVVDYVQLLSGHPDLDRVIELLRDHVTSSAEKNKEILLEMAKINNKIPLKTTKLGTALRNYTNPNGSCYDGQFTADIQYWYSRINKFDAMCEKKQQFIIMAESKMPVPLHDKTQMALLSYYCRVDENFKAVISCWYNPKQNKTDIFKQRLIRLMKANKPVPLRRTVLGQKLRRYTNPNSTSWDEKFSNIISKWYKPGMVVTTTVFNRKQELIDMMVSGKPIPKSGTILYKRLLQYVNDDQNFAETVSGWYEKRDRDVLVVKQKQKFLQMMNDGIPIPKHGTSDRDKLRNYIKKDHEFRKLIEPWLET